MSNVVTLPGLRVRRLQAALTQEDLADKSGVSRLTIVRLERGGKANPHTMGKLADALGCTPADLMSEDQT